jgi:hypothetical protein
MGAHVVADCPRCKAVKMTHDVHGASMNTSDIWDIFAACRRCGRGSVFTISGLVNRNPLVHMIDKDILRAVGGDGRLVAVAPPQAKPGGPDGLPPAVLRTYLQGRSALERGELDASGAMFRKSIDIATSMMDQALASKKLVARIDALAASGLLTSTLKEWAHQIRLDGNDAVHDEDEPTRQGAEQLASFTEMFLIYTFTMPHAIATKRATKVE